MTMIRNNNKQKVTTERIFNLLKKRDHYKDLSTLDLEEEINAIVSTKTLYKKDKKFTLYWNFGKHLEERSQTKQTVKPISRC